MAQMANTNNNPMNMNPQGGLVISGSPGNVSAPSMPNMSGQQGGHQPTMIQLPTSLNPNPMITATTSNLITNTNPNGNTATFMLDPATNQLQQMHQAPQLVPNPNINQLIFPSQAPLQQQPQLSQVQVKIEDSPMTNGNATNLPPNSVLGARFATPQVPSPKINGTNSPVTVKTEIKPSIVSTVTQSSATNGTSSSNYSNFGPHNIVPLDKERLQHLVREVDPNEQLEEEVEDVLLSLADDFVDSLVSSSCMVAKHRKSKTLEISDVQMVLEV